MERLKEYGRMIILRIRRFFAHLFRRDQKVFRRLGYFLDAFGYGGLAVVLLIIAANRPSALNIIVPQAVADTGAFVAQFENKPLASGIINEVQGHYPDTDGGALIGFGYNLKAHRPEVIEKDLSATGISSKRIEDIKRCASISGLEGYGVHDCPQVMTLSRDESFKLLNERLQRDVTAVEEQAARRGIKLTPCQIMALASLRYNGTALVDDAPNLWDAIQRQDRADIWYEIVHNSGAQRLVMLKSRREIEASMFLNDRCSDSQKILARY